MFRSYCATDVRAFTYALCLHLTIVELVSHVEFSPTASYRTRAYKIFLRVTTF